MVKTRDKIILFFSAANLYNLLPFSLVLSCNEKRLAIFYGKPSFPTLELNSPSIINVTCLGVRSHTIVNAS